MITLLASLVLAAAPGVFAPHPHAAAPESRTGLSGVALVRPGAHGAVGGPKAVKAGLDGGHVSRRRGPPIP
jgi:hypothetical protein